MNFIRSFPLFLLLLVGGCAGNAVTQAPRASANVLTAEELQAGVYETVFDAVSALRSNWLRERPPSDYTGDFPEVAQVFVDGLHLGDVSVLRQILPRDVAHLRYLTVTQAAATIGRLANANPVIQVTTRRGP